MSQSQEVRALMCPPIWSALPLFGSGTKSRMRVPAVIPKTGDTYREQKRCMGLQIMLTHPTEWIFILSQTWEQFRGDKCHMPDKQQCVYNLNGRPLCLQICLTSYTGLVERRTLPLLAPLALCVGLSMRANIQDSKRVVWLRGLLCELCTKVKPHKCPSAITFTIISFFLRASMFVHVCVCVGQETKGRMGCVGEHLFE